MKRILAISDIHGCAKTFIKMLETINLTKEDTLVIIGDLIDRGPNTKMLIDEIFRLRSEGYDIVVLMGNHEVMMMESDTFSGARFWVQNGGHYTLDSFDINQYKELEQKYKTFFENLPYHYLIDKFIFVHAGINTKKNKNPFNEDTNIWARKWYADFDHLDRVWLGDRYIIHGHTPHKKEDVEEQFEMFEITRYLNIDSSCCFNNHLCLVDLTNMKLYFEQNIDLI